MGCFKSTECVDSGSIATAIADVGRSDDHGPSGTNGPGSKGAVEKRPPLFDTLGTPPSVPDAWDARSHRARPTPGWPAGQRLRGCAAAGGVITLRASRAQ